MSRAFNRRFKTIFARAGGGRGERLHALNIVPGALAIMLLALLATYGLALAACIQARPEFL